MDEQLTSAPSGPNASVPGREKAIISEGSASEEETNQTRKITGFKVSQVSYLFVPIQAIDLSLSVVFLCGQ